MRFMQFNSIRFLAAFAGFRKSNMVIVSASVCVLRMLRND